MTVATDCATRFVNYPHTEEPPEGILQRWNKVLDQATAYARDYSEKSFVFRQTEAGTAQDWENLRDFSERQLSMWGEPPFPGGRPAAGLQGPGMLGRGLSIEA